MVHATSNLSFTPPPREPLSSPEARNVDPTTIREHERRAKMDKFHKRKHKKGARD
jgi:hypothetical protein